MALALARGRVVGRRFRFVVARLLHARVLVAWRLGLFRGISRHKKVPRVGFENITGGFLLVVELVG